MHRTAQQRTNCATALQWLVEKSEMQPGRSAWPVHVPAQCSEAMRMGLRRLKIAQQLFLAEIAPPDQHAGCYAFPMLGSFYEIADGWIKISESVALREEETDDGSGDDTEDAT